ncbi:hypothetical protein [Janthinobacterium psychrotolerans]|uniref:Uncharacterized protein n=1 Tax=Janthinobacterium psychrotolerans TaxID=1747903 RepID=A0A1A7BWG1_9BURK|nr:hypothetical protein [Janthinobacterium psychrotolerans]OBV36850.1 hypothetical protein ASR47_1001327 [Janthinobacterium psychrotolerans]
MQITPSIFLSSRLASPTSMYRLTLYLPAGTARWRCLATQLWRCWALSPCTQAQDLATDTQSQLAHPVPRQVLVLYSLGSDASSL